MKRPVNKDPLLINASLYELSGIGEKRMAAFAALGLHTVEDLLQFPPRTYINRGRITPIRELRDGLFASIVGVVENVRTIPRKRLTFTLRDASGVLSIVFFGGLQYMTDRFEDGIRLNAWGKVAVFNNTLQMAHPEYKILEKDRDPEKGIFPVYVRPEELKGATIDSKIIQAAVRDALARTREHLPEALPAFIIRKQGFPPLKEIYREIHFPSNDSPAYLYGIKSRLKYEEAFALCLKMAALARYGDTEGHKFKPSLNVLSHVYQKAGFTPTAAQTRVISEIEEDLFKGRKLYRLLQGDVGSGKTFVCAVVMAHVMENGFQAALLAPTEILARQHFKELTRLFEGSGKRLALFIGGMAVSERRKLDKALAEGEIDLAIGTHALISASTRFKRLGLVIVDEQHRFGVRQRLAMRQKGGEPGILVVSATPIPRTLAMTLYGDLKISTIDALPPGRIPVKTFRVSEAKRADMYRFIEDKIKSGGRAFFILPLLEDSEKLEEVKSVLSMGAHLQNDIFKAYSVDILHGKMDPPEKDRILKRFREGACQVLAATTVVEVGIDIPEADVMVVEHPERFGLAQLHQLRGRIGRGSRESFCFLLSGGAGGQEAAERLKRFSEMSDGFAIAELDFELRGTGDLAGLRQSGLPDFKFLDLVNDYKIVESAKEDAVLVTKGNPVLEPGDAEKIAALLKRYDGIREDHLETA